MKSNVREYKTAELIQLMSKTNGFRDFPKNPFLLYVRSNEDAFNVYDDKCYLFERDANSGLVCNLVTSCTTNSGSKGLLTPSNPLGTAVIKFDEWYYDSFMKSDGANVRHHKDKMPCLRQMRDLLYYRDNNRDQKIDAKGKIYKGNYSTNIHANNYNFTDKLIKWVIGGWGEGCLVHNLIKDYLKILNSFKYGEPISICCINEKQIK